MSGDPRTKNLAKILVGYSTKVKEGDVVTIDGEIAAEPLLLAVYEEVLRAGGHPIINMSPDGASAAYFEHASDEQLEWVSPVAEWAIENADVRIAAMASTNTRELSGVPPQRQQARQAATQHLMKKAMERSAKGEYPKDRPYKVPHLLSTLYRAVGIDPAMTFNNGSGRPMYVLDERDVVSELV